MRRKRRAKARESLVVVWKEELTLHLDEPEIKTEWLMLAEEGTLIIT